MKGQTNDSTVIREFMEQLNLDPVAKDTFIGHIDRVPFRMEMVVNSQTVGLLFHTRFSKTLQPIPEFPTPPTGGILESIIAAKKAELSADESQVWFNLFAAHELIESNSLLPALQEFAASIHPYVDFEKQACFLCKTEKETLPLYHTEKIHLICDECHNRLNDRAEQLSKIDPTNFILGLLWGGLASIGSGLVWCVAWIIHNWIFANARVPVILYSIASLAIAGAVAFPMAYVLKKIPRRGTHLAKLTTVTTCLLAALWGECLFDIYLCLKSIGRFPSLVGILRIEHLLLQEFSSFYWMLKLFALILACVVCVIWSTPKIDLQEHVRK